MLSITARKISGHGFSLACAAALLTCGVAHAAAGDAQVQAAALLSTASASRAEPALTSLSTDGAAASPIESQEKARWLLAGKPVSSAGSARADTQTSARNAGAVQADGMAYAGAQDSARRMILGKGV